jgi:hypothetical protein
MRSVLRIAALALALSGLWACDSEQPLQGGPRVAVVSLDAVAQLEYYDVWEVWDDLDGNGSPEVRVVEGVPPVPVWRCDDPGVVTDGQLPWSYAIEVAVLRRGSVTREIIATTSRGLQAFSSSTPFDPASAPIGALPPVGTRHYINGVRVSRGNGFYLQACLGAETLPIPNLAGRTNPPTLDVPLNPGDTIIVSARLARASANQIFPSFYPNPVLNGSIQIDGRPVPIVGSSQSTDDDGAGLTFSYTVN